jgi:hypothetical protein
MMVRRDVLPTYPAQALALAEDSITIARLCSLHPTLLVDRPEIYCYIVHGANSYEDAHFETMMSWASETRPYDNGLADLASMFPISDYAARMSR